MRWGAGLVLLGALGSAPHASAEPPETEPVPVAVLEKRLDDAKQRTAAARELLRRRPGHARAQELVVAQLRHEEWYTRWKACLALAKAGSACAERALPELILAARDRDRDICREARIALERVAPPELQSKWRERHERMKREGPRIRDGNLFALREVGYADDAVIRAVLHPDPVVVVAALDELAARAYLEPDAYVPYLVAAQHRPHAFRWGARKLLAARSAGRYRRLIPWPQDPVSVVRLNASDHAVERAAAALVLPYVTSDPADARTRLLDRLAFDPDPRVRDAAAEALVVLDAGR